MQRAVRSRIHYTNMAGKSLRRPVIVLYESLIVGRLRQPFRMLTEKMPSALHAPHVKTNQGYMRAAEQNRQIDCLETRIVSVMNNLWIQ